MKNFLVLAVAAVLAACGGGSKTVRSSGGDDTPSWLSQGSGAYTTEAGKRLQGVGLGTQTDPKARRHGADLQAAQQLQGTVTALAALLAKVSESTKENVGDEIGAIARRAAPATSHVRDHWVTPDGSESALDQIELGAFKQAIQSAEGDEKLKAEMVNNLDRAFEQLARQ
jgi:hypothetical protein